MVCTIYYVSYCVHVVPKGTWYCIFIGVVLYTIYIKLILTLYDCYKFEYVYIRKSSTGKFWDKINMMEDFKIIQKYKGEKDAIFYIDDEPYYFARLNLVERNKKDGNIYEIVELRKVNTYKKVIALNERTNK